MIKSNTKDVAYNSLSTSLKNASPRHKKIYITLILITLFSVMTLSSAHAAQKVTTQFCMTVSNTHGGSDSDGIYMNLHGNSGLQTGYAKLNNPGKNDFIKGQESCFAFEPWNLPNKRDVGFHKRAVISMKSDFDDFCVSKIYSERLVNFKPATGEGKILTTSRFGDPSKEYCFGNYDRNSKKARAFNATNRAPKKKVALKAGKLRAKWVFLCNTKCQESSSYTVTTSKATEKVNSSETKKALSIAINVGVDLPFGSASTEVTASTEKTIGETFSTALSQENSLTKNDGVLYSPDELSKYGIHKVWQWVAVSRLSNGKEVMVRSKIFTCTPDGNEPTYLPDSSRHIGACSTEKEKEMSAIERAQLEKAQLEIAVLKQKAGMAQQPQQQQQYQQQEQQYQPQEQQQEQYNSADLEITPPSSPVRVWMPSSWVKADVPSYDVFYTDPGEDAFVAFRFMNKETAATVINELNAGLNNMVSDIKESEAAQNFDITGMPTRLNSYTGNMSGSSVEMSVLYVDPPSSNQSVFIVAVVGSSKAAEFDVTLSDIIEGIEPN